MADVAELCVIERYRGKEKMYVQQLSVKNYRCFSEFSAIFVPGLNVVAGNNGAGKTSVLKAVACALSPVAHQCGADICTLEREDVRRQVTAYGKRVRFEPQFPCECEVLYQCGNTNLTLGQKQDAVSGSPVWTGNYYLITKNIGKILPLFTFYSAERQWILPGEYSETNAVAVQDSRWDGYRGWVNASNSHQAFYKWMIDRSIARLQLAVDRQVGFWHVEDDELAEVNRALKKALPNEFESIAYDMSAKSIVVEISGKRVDFASLSDGERSFICLFTDIARRMCLLNPQLGDKVIAETEGIVLIDELDVHLHPAWQRKIVKGLQGAFPKVQFIVTTHSPQILSEVSPQNILLLQNGKVVRPDQAKGLTSDEILRNVMGTEDRPDFAKESLDKVYEALDAGRYEDARRELDKMETIAGGPTEDTLQLGALIRTLAVSEG